MQRVPPSQASTAPPTPNFSSRFPFLSLDSGEFTDDDAGDSVFFTRQLSIPEEPDQYPQDVGSDDLDKVLCQVKTTYDTKYGSSLEALESYDSQQKLEHLLDEVKALPLSME